MFRAFLLGAIAASVLSAAGPAAAQRWVEEAQDRFLEALMAVEHTDIPAGATALRASGQPVLLDNPGNARALVLGCEAACQNPRLRLRVAGMPDIVATGDRTSPRRVVLMIPPAYARSLSNLEIEIEPNCGGDRHCAHQWGLLTGGAPPTLVQRGMPPPITDAQWNAATDLRPQWRQRPNADDLRFYYPANAWRSGLAGSARLQCIVAAGGALRCRLQGEEPRGHGFGSAAVRLATLLRVADQDENGQPTVGRRITVPIVFQPTAGS